MIDLVKIKEIPLPAKTDSYSPVAHADIIESVYEQLDKANLVVKSSNVKFARNGQQMIGTMAIESYDSEMGFKIALRNSYDKSMSVGFASGGNVWVCSNGSISGDIKLVRKHTGLVNQEIKLKIIESINAFEPALEELIVDREKLKTVELSKRLQAELVGRMFLEQDIITSTQINIIKREMDFSEHFKDNTLWSLYNWTTESLKQSHPSSYIEDHVKVHKFLTELV